MTPILAGVLAYIDRNNNLDLLVIHPPKSWVSQFWLTMLNDPSATELKYAYLQSDKKHAELTKMPVKMTAYGNQLMSGKMPFSWELKAHIDELLYKTKNTKGKMGS